MRFIIVIIFVRDLGINIRKDVKFFDEENFLNSNKNVFLKFELMERYVFFVVRNFDCYKNGNFFLN